MWRKAEKRLNFVFNILFMIRTIRALVPISQAVMKNILQNKSALKILKKT